MILSEGTFWAEFYLILVLYGVFPVSIKSRNPKNPVPLVIEVSKPRSSVKVYRAFVITRFNVRRYVEGFFTYWEGGSFLLSVEVLFPQGASFTGLLGLRGSILTNCVEIFLLTRKSGGAFSLGWRVISVSIKPRSPKSPVK